MTVTGASTRREWLAGAGAAALAGSGTARTARALATALPARVEPLPLADVRLDPSPFRTAWDANRGYVMSLDPDRLLHNFRAGAGLPPKAAVYGGWESDTIAGHTLGHYLSALALIHAQDGDDEAARRVDRIVAELTLVQRTRGDGYVAGLLRKRADGTLVDGHEMFEEIARGDIRARPFDLNGSWSPLYTIHKLFAGLLDAHKLCGSEAALAVAVGLAGYFARMFDRLDDAQMQRLLACEYGGLNESFAELAARTGEARWMAVAKRLHDRAVLDPLAARRDELGERHANTQVPKLIGLARIHELTGDPAAAAAARFFWEAVTRHHSYVIGGNADREIFSAPDAIARHVTEQTCEHCNSYNMLKLTRHLFAWRPDGALFDYYERTHLNHVLAAQNPATGMFAYMMPMMAGARRDYSTPTGDFWCCVGTGMESHAKHGDSIYWHGDDMLLVNLFVPSRARWSARGAEIELATGYPHEGAVRLTVAALARPDRFAIAMRIPGWAAGAGVRVNGARVDAVRASGYAIVRRRWRAGDRLELTLPLALRTEATPDDPRLIAVLRGPLVLAADLGAADAPLAAGPPPAFVGADPLRTLAAVDGQPGWYRTQGGVRPADLTFRPFYSAHDRRSAVYLPRLDADEWADRAAAFAAAQAAEAELAARSADTILLGDPASEAAHGLSSALSYPLTYRGRLGRDARDGGYLAFRLTVKPGPLLLGATYWGEDGGRMFTVSIDRTVIATETLAGDAPGRFVDRRYPVPAALTAGKASVTVRVEPRAGHGAGPIFGMRLFSPPADGAGATVQATT